MTYHTLVRSHFIAQGVSTTVACGVSFLRNISPQGKVKLLYKEDPKNVLYIKKDDEVCVCVGGWMDGWVVKKFVTIRFKL